MKKINIHLLVWLGLIALKFISLIENNSFMVSITVAGFIYMCYALVFYSASKIHQQFYENKRFLLYGLFLFVVLIFGTVLVRVIGRVSDFFIEGTYTFGIGNYAFFRVFFFMLFGVLYQLLLEHKKAEEKNKNLELEKRETELQFLKSQMNPHFFFNTLNNIYGLAYQKNDMTPKAILKLSEAMRYVIYETKSDQVSLMKELQFINNYIELERLRLVHKENLIYQNEVNWFGGKIAPLVLLPFVENCFKHSNIDEDEDSEINISIWIEDGVLHLSCGNTMSGKANYKEGGVGTSNVMKRLELLYGDKYSLHNESTSNSYFVLLKLPLEL